MIVYLMLHDFKETHIKVDRVVRDVKGSTVQIVHLVKVVETRDEEMGHKMLLNIDRSECG